MKQSAPSGWSRGFAQGRIIPDLAARSSPVTHSACQVFVFPASIRPLSIVMELLL
jgi:hypothetical protein